MFFFIDKPVGMSSFDVLRKLRKTLWTKKLGYIWTLDPLASWCLLVASDKSTKLISLLEKSEKTYLFTVDISWKSASLDCGTSVEKAVLDRIIKRSSEELHSFLLSQTSQIPPSYSAIHVNGERAYKLARDNKEINLESRNIMIKGVEILEFSPPIFTIQIRISSGWYIRSFAPLIGEFFGVLGWYISMLRRETLHLPSWDFSISQAQRLDDFSKKESLSYEEVFSHIPIETISSEIYHQLLHGKEISIGDRSYTDWQNVLLRYGDNFTSLVIFRDNHFCIVRNDV